MSVVRVLIVDDSTMFAEAVAGMLSSDPEIRIAGTVHNGSDAVVAVERLRPDLIVMDLHMPVMGGLDAIELIMARRPTPILVLTSHPRDAHDTMAMEAIRRGALDLVQKPGRMPAPDAVAAALREKIKLLSSVAVVHHPRANLVHPVRHEPVAGRAELIAIVGSTGAPAALASILRALPGDFAAPIVVVQHIVAGFVESLAAWLDVGTPLSVVVAKDGTEPRRGIVYIAPDHQHVTLERRTLRVRKGIAVRGSVPSGDVLLESIAAEYGTSGGAVILSGMGDDGARGAKKVRAAGGIAMGQDEQSSVVFGMARAAWEMGALERLVPLDDIAPTLVEITGARAFARLRAMVDAQ